MSPHRPKPAPRRCECLGWKKITVWHCLNCMRWKPAALAMCERCAALAQESEAA